MIIDHDMHVHTALSACCSDATATPANILQRARECGLRTIGFADHLWDRACPGASPWYVPQDLDHVLQIRGQLPPAVDGLCVRCGCESEYGGPGKLGIGAAGRARLDFVLLPMSHFHMRGFIVPADLAQPADIAALLVQRFNEVVALGLADGIAHPFLPCGHVDKVDAVIGLIPDDTFRRGFAGAARAGVSIEITLGFFPGCGAGEKEGFHDGTFLRVLRLAKAEGCCFHFASDTHSLAGVGGVKKLAPYVEALGLTPGDIAPWVHR